MINELDLRALWKELDVYEKDLEAEAKSLQEVWITIADLKAKNDAELLRLSEQPELVFLPGETLIGLNVGGQIFEATVEILARDPYSLLAACCRTSPPFPRDADGFFYFDRDWWLFRHILSFLRSNILPTDLETLKELYSEASFYRLESLVRAIEDVPVSQITNIYPR